MEYSYINVVVCSEYVSDVWVTVLHCGYTSADSKFTTVTRGGIFLVILIKCYVVFCLRGGR